MQQLNDSSVVVGASVSLNDVEDLLAEATKKAGDHRSRAWEAILKQLHWFASTPIRNAACLGGNLATASPISDVNPLLMACNATVLSLVRAS